MKTTHFSLDLLVFWFFHFAFSFVIKLYNCYGKEKRFHYEAYFGRNREGDREGF
jgi:uncharacterized membrane protein